MTGYWQLSTYIGALWTLPYTTVMLLTSMKVITMNSVPVIASSSAVLQKRGSGAAPRGNLVRMRNSFFTCVWRWEPSPIRHLHSALPNTPSDTQTNTTTPILHHLWKDLFFPVGWTSPQLPVPLLSLYKLWKPYLYCSREERISLTITTLSM